MNKPGPEAAAPSVSFECLAEQAPVDFFLIQYQIIIRLDSVRAVALLLSPFPNSCRWERQSLCCELKLLLHALVLRVSRAMRFLFYVSPIGLVLIRLRALCFVLRLC